MLGIGIPYYKNSPECEVRFKKLMTTLYKQYPDRGYILVYEDGQKSDWLSNYNIGYGSSLINRGVSYARNFILDVLKYQVDYILFIDSDDMIDCDFIPKMEEACKTGNYDMIISPFYMNGVEQQYITRSNVAGIALRVDFIKDLVFDERYLISEDTIFINKVYERNPRIGTINSNYYYNYGANPNSLMMKYARSEIGLKKKED